MKLTGKCKEDFIEFLLNTDCKYSINIEEGQLVSEAFFECPLSMQYGVLIDFFDSVGIRIVIDMDFENEVYNKFVLYIEYKKYSFCNYGMNFKTRQEARTAAVKMANEIYNSK